MDGGRDRLDVARRALRPEWPALVAVLALATYLRLHALGLVEFKGDEATAFSKAGRLLDGVWPTVGLCGSRTSRPRGTRSSRTT